MLHICYWSASFSFSLRFSGLNRSSGSESTDETYNKMQGYPPYFLEAGGFTRGWIWFLLMLFILLASLWLFVWSLKKQYILYFKKPTNFCKKISTYNICKGVLGLPVSNRVACFCFSQNLLLILQLLNFTITLSSSLLPHILQHNTLASKK